MELNLNKLVVGLSRALDFMEIDFLGVVSNHSKRVAYIALQTAIVHGMGHKELFDLATLAILHDNGMGKAFQLARDSKAPSQVGPEEHTMNKYDKGPGHCVAGEENVKGFPFLTVPKEVLRYHHENYDGSGFFHVKGEQIPCMAQLIRLADMVELHADLRNIDFAGKHELGVFLAKQDGTTLSPEIVADFWAAASYPAFWLDLKDEFVELALSRLVPRFSTNIRWQDLRKVTRIFSRIIDSKSRFTLLHSQELAERTGRMGAFYGLDDEHIAELQIAADLHDIGKLAVCNDILEKPGKLGPEEIDVIQRHTYYTRISLQSVTGFENITEWAANHHEKLDGSGYPYKKKAADLDFNARLLACLDVYQALTEERPYRGALSHAKAMEILGELVVQGKIDSGIVQDIDQVFGVSNPSNNAKHS